MNRDELGVMTSPRPAPAWSRKDLLIPTPAALGVTVLSGSWAWLMRVNQAPAMRIVRLVKSSIPIFVFEYILRRSFKHEFPFTQLMRSLDETGLTN
jgi:hypothetical protein